MAVEQKLVSIDEYFEVIENRKILLNDYSIFNFNHAKEFYNSLVTEFEDDTISLLPKCSKGCTQGEYYKGSICPKCGTMVTDMNYDPVVWAKVLHPDYLFISPIFYDMLNSLLQKDIKYLTGVTDAPRTKSNISINVARDVLHHERTYANFLANIRNIIVYLSGLSSYKSGHRAESASGLLALWDNEKDLIMSHYIPLVNNVLFNMIKTNKGKYTDVGLAEVFDIASVWMRVANKQTATEALYDKTTAKLVDILGSMPEFYIRYYLSKKPGIFRKNIYGFRSPFTFRCVITSKTGKHQYDEIEAPWVTGVSVFRPHVLNKLLKRGYNYKKAKAKIDVAAKLYDEEIYQILEELIKESKYKGIPIMLHRNPSLHQLSSQIVYITKFKKDPEDNTNTVSVLILSYCHGDIDGDELNAYLLGDNEMAELFQSFSSHYGVPGKEPYSISGKLTLFSPANTILLEWLNAEHDHPENDTVLNKLL